MPRGGPPRRGRALATWITILAASVAALVAVVAAFVSVEVVRTAVTRMTHQELSAGMSVMADTDLSTAERAARAWSAGSGDLWAAIAPDGTVRGTATRWVDRAVIAQVLSGRTVSDTARSLPSPVVLEARPVGDGGIVLARPESAVVAAIRGILVVFIPIVLAAAVLAALGGALLARRIARPLEATAAAARAMAAGARGVALPHARVPEIDDVAHALATLDSALAASEGRQREFLLSVSHELRTPLTALRGYAEALADGMIPPDRVAPVGSTLVAEAVRAERFVGDLLELARLESDDFRIDVAPTDLVGMARAAAAAWEGSAARIGVRIDVTADTGTVIARTDAHRVRQLVDGLIENALRVSPDGAELRIHVSDAAAWAFVAVRDQGPGLSDDDLAHAFDRGVLHERYRDSRPAGTGLGLSIAHRLAGRLGGTIAAERADGGGSVFTLRLPRS